ncbi:MAG: hypothetical protein J6L62_00630, partial [Clostridia bacterium]|nr:hypothetical protein [Clostridia bacterium]
TFYPRLKHGTADIFCLFIRMLLTVSNTVISIQKPTQERTGASPSTRNGKDNLVFAAKKNPSETLKTAL